MGNPILYEVVDKAYNKAIELTPECMHDRPIFSAFMFGAAGTYAVIKGVQWAIKKLAPKFNKNVVPTLEKAAMAAITVAPVIYSAVDPEGAHEILTQHPVYTSGMAGFYVASMGAALQDLGNRNKESLDEKVTKETVHQE